MDVDLHLLFRFAFSLSLGVQVSHSDSLGPFQGFQIVDWERKTCCSWMEESAGGDKDCEAPGSGPFCLALQDGF